MLVTSAPVVGQSVGVVAGVLAPADGLGGRMRERDPGLLRLAQAVKTLAAVLLGLGIFYRADLQTRMFAGITAGFLMQCTSTGARWRRQATMAVTAGAMASVVVVAGGVLAGWPLAQDAVLVAVAFGAFYARRFLPDQGLFVVFGFVVCLLAVAFPAGWGRAGMEALAIGAAFAVAFGVHFFVAPPDPRRAFEDALAAFAARAGRFVGPLEAALRQRTPLRPGPALKRHEALQANVTFTQQFADQWREALGGGVEAPLVAQYEALHALGMLGANVWRLTSAEGSPAAAAGCEEADLPAEAYAQLAAIVGDLREGFERRAVGLRGAGGAVDGAGQRAAEFEALQAVVLRANHPLCPRAARLFSALVAARQIGGLQGVLAHGARSGAGVTAVEEVSGAAATASARQGEGVRVRERVQGQTRMSAPPGGSATGDGVQRLESHGGQTGMPAPPGGGNGSTGSGAGLRTPLRAAVSVAIALAVGRVFALERSYWAVLVAVLLVNGTWGENTQRALTRFGMTVAGCAAAAGLLWLTDGNHAARVAVMLGGILMAAYFRTSSYALLTFFVTLYVVFLFALIGQAPSHVVVVRTYETVIGCAVALAASVIVPAPRSTRAWEAELAEVWAACRDGVEGAFAALTGEADARPPDARDLIARLRSLRVHYEAAAYEGALHGAARRGRRAAMERVRRVAHHVLSLAEAARGPHDAGVVSRVREDLAALGRGVVARFDEVGAMDVGVAEAGGRPDRAFDEVQERLRARVMAGEGAGRLTPGELAWVGSVIYHARQIGRAIAGET